VVQECSKTNREAERKRVKQIQKKPSI